MKKFIGIIGIGILVYMYMQTKKRKRRRLLEEKPPRNKVSEDFGGTVPELLYKYLESLKEEKGRGNYQLFGYQEVLGFSRKVSTQLEKDIVIVLGVEKKLTEELGKNTYLLYSKVGYPDSLVLVTLDWKTGNLEYYQRVSFEVLK